MAPLDSLGAPAPAAKVSGNDRGQGQRRAVSDEKAGNKIMNLRGQIKAGDRMRAGPLKRV